jgi:hypothetical protein
MRKIIFVFCGFILYAGYVALPAANAEIATIIITKENLATLPVPSDFKNYYILQSFDKVTNVIIADFGGAEKTICLLVDKNSDGTLDDIWEYYPDSGQYARPEKPTSSLFSGYPQIKRDIIEGKVFNKIGKAGNTEYTHAMASLPIVKQKIQEGRMVSRRGHDGRYVRLVDPDIKDSTMSDFYFGKEIGAYDLQFKTLYYKNGTIKIEPLINYSVFAKGSHDAVIAEYVEALLKMAKDKKL